MDAARAEPALCDLEAAPSPSRIFSFGTRTFSSSTWAWPCGRIVEAEHRQHLLDLDAGGIERHQDLRLLLMLGGVEIGLAHQDRDLAAGSPTPDDHHLRPLMT